METDGLSVRDITQFARVNERTARRWKARGKIPEPYASLVRFRVRAELGALEKSWDGWCFRRGELVSPEGQSFRPGEIRALPLQHAALSAYRQEAQRQRQDALEARQLAYVIGDLRQALDTLQTAVQAVGKLIAPKLTAPRAPRRPLPPTPLYLVPNKAHASAQSRAVPGEDAGHGL